ncbi:hypothetical protein QEN19_003973 [Hanseniaspora menglaensis]
MVSETSYIENLLSSSCIFSAETLPKNIDLKEVAKFVDVSLKGKFNWLLNKTFTKNFKNITTYTYTQQLNNDFWCMRYTILEDVSIEAFRNEFVKKLNGSIFDVQSEKYVLTSDQLPSRCYLEKEYIHSLVDVTCRDMIVSEGSSSGFVNIKNVYELKPSWLLNKRSFCQWVYVGTPFISDDGSYEISVVVSLRAAQEKSDATNGYYVSVECLKYDIHNKILVWSMATCSDAGGYLPKYLQKAGIDKAIVEDVPSFLKFIKF